MPPYLFDIWTLAHAAFFFGIGVTVWKLFKPSWLVTGLIALGLGISWELAESWLEHGLGYSEPWYNRWGTDVLADVVGAVLGRRSAKKDVL